MNWSLPRIEVQSLSICARSTVSVAVIMIDILISGRSRTGAPPSQAPPCVDPRRGQGERAEVVPHGQADYPSSAAAPSLAPAKTGSVVGRGFARRRDWAIFSPLPLG